MEMPIKSKLLFSSCLVGLLISLTSVLTAATPCTTTTLASLQASGGCLIGDKNFFGFSLSDISGVAVLASDVAVTPITSEPFGFTFNLQTSPASGTTFIAINFQVATALGANTIDDLELNTSGISGGSTGAVENACFGAGNVINGFLPSGIPTCALIQNGLRLVTGYGNGSSALATFSPASVVNLSTGFIFNNGTPISITEQISQVPEPSALMPFCIGLLTFGLIGVKTHIPKYARI